MTKKLIGRGLSCLLLSSFLSLPALAEDDEKINFSGFASFAYGKALDDGSAFLDISDEGEYRDWNVLGLRLDTDLGDGLEFAAQVAARGRDDYAPEFDWIYANINVAKYIDIKVGRTRIPLYMYSDYLEVGYATPWVRPPRSVYGDASFNTMEGINVTFSYPLGPVQSSLQVYGGSTKEELNEDHFKTTLHFDDVRGFSWGLGYEWLELRASYFEAKSSADLSQVQGFESAFAALQDINKAIGGNFIDEVLWEDDEANFTGIGMSMDFDHTFIIAERSRIRDSKTAVIQDIDSYYVTFGIRPVTDWTFSLTYERDKDEARSTAVDNYNEDMIAWLSDPANADGTGVTLTGSDFEGLSSFLRDIEKLQGFPTGALEGVDDITKLGMAQATLVQLQTVGNHNDTTYTFNTRWDFHEKAACTVEYLYKENKGYGELVSDSSNGIRLSLDLIF